MFPVSITLATNLMKSQNDNLIWQSKFFVISTFRKSTKGFFLIPRWPRHGMDTLTCRILTRDDTELIDTKDIDTAWHATFGTRHATWYQDPLPRFWYQDLGTKKNGEPERRSLSVYQGGTVGCKRPARGPGGLEAPQEQQGVPSESNFMAKRWNLCTPSRTRFSNGLAYNWQNVSVKNSQIGFVVINFLRSIFPYMSNIYENG